MIGFDYGMLFNLKSFNNFGGLKRLFLSNSIDGIAETKNES
jgi:hypothetical protein